MSTSGYVDRKTFFGELFPKDEPKRIVIKTGTNVLEKDGKLNTDKMGEIAKTLSDLRKNGVELYYVSSGAILAAMDKLGTNRTEFRKRYNNEKEYLRALQLLSGIGQHRLMCAYEHEFDKYKDDKHDKHGQLISQVQLTKNDRSSYVDTVSRYAKNGVIPIINENDNLATDEITFGDNDNLAKMVAEDLEADLLIILSDTIYYDKNPREHTDTTPFYEVDNITRKMIKDADSKGPWGTGGMKTKLTTAKYLNKKGIPVVLLNGKNDSVDQICNLLKGEEEIGTLFIPKRKRSYLGRLADYFIHSGT